MEELLVRYPCIKECANEIESAIKVLIETYEKGGKLLVCGNGGSCADSDHIVGELMKGFLSLRPLDEEKKNEMRHYFPQMCDWLLSKLQFALPAISLCSLTALNTAFSNDVEPDVIYAQSVMGLGTDKDTLLCISTSGNSKNCFYAAEVAKALGGKVIALTGKTGGKLKEIADVCICAPESETYKVQELHLPIYHYICAQIEKHFFG